MKRLFVYEIRKKIDEFNSKFYAYVIFDSIKRELVGISYNSNVYIARARCKQILNTLIVSEDTSPIVVWRSCPLSLWEKEITDESICKRIMTREIVI